MGKLSYYPGTQPAVIFYRRHTKEVSEITFGSRVKISGTAKEEIGVKCLPNTSVFAAYQAVNINIPQVENITRWAHKNVFPLVEPDSPISNYAEKQMLLNEDNKSFVLNFLKEADFNISDIATKKESKKVSDDFIQAITTSSNIPEGEKNRLRNEKTIESLSTTFSHLVTDNTGKRGKYELSELLQSKGTIRAMILAGVIGQAVSENALLFIDQIESSIHPRLVEFIIEQFLTLSEQAQLLVTTHNESLLGETDLLRNDNIWFTSKRKDGSTELYSLSDFKGLGRISSLQKAYKYGKFGATPNI